MFQNWFTDAKLGIFITWGIYSTGRTTESWAFWNDSVPYEEYMRQAAEFTASAYDPESWVELFKQAGARYAVLTTKHHDGFALWDTRWNKLNAKDGAPAGRDLVGPYVNALRRRGLKVGLYYSHADWSHPDYATMMPTGAQPHGHEKMRGNRFSYPQSGDSPERWERFLEFHRGQIRELCERYHPDLLWFDGDWERDDSQWRFAELKDQLQQWAPGVIVCRMGAYGDYLTPEQGIPITKPPRLFEYCVTINDSWGYAAWDTNYKSPTQCLRMLAECAGMGGNLLLDIGPKADGTLQPEQVKVLEAMGRWLAKNGEAIHSTAAGLPQGLFYGASTLSKDRTTLYLISFDGRPRSLAVKGLRNKVHRASVVGHGPVSSQVVGGASFRNIPGITWIDVPDEAVDPLATVVRLELEGPLSLYAGAGEAIAKNG